MPSKTRRIRKGGKYIAQGSYGCIFKPQILCQGQEKAKNDFVSKYINAAFLKEEMAGKDLFAMVDPDRKYFIYPDEPCIPAAAAVPENVASCTLKNVRTKKPLYENFANPETRRLIQMPDGGDDLSRIMLKAEEYIPFFRSLTNLFEGLAVAHTNGVFHNDIKTLNIVSKKNADGTFTTRFIDLGFACRAVDFDKFDVNSQLNLITHRPYYIPFDTHFLLDKRIVNYADPKSPEYYKNYQFHRKFGIIADDFVQKKYIEDLTEYKKYLEGNIYNPQFKDITTFQEYRKLITRVANVLYFPAEIYENTETPEGANELLTSNINYLYFSDNGSPRPDKERYTIVLQKSDIFSLGVALYDIYRGLIAQVWSGELRVPEEDENGKYTFDVIPYVINTLINEDGNIKQYDAEDLCYTYDKKPQCEKHEEVSSRLSVKYFELIKNMMMPNIKLRWDASKALEYYKNEVLVLIEELLTPENVNILASSPVVANNFIGKPAENIVMNSTSKKSSGNTEMNSAPKKSSGNTEMSSAPKKSSKNRPFVSVSLGGASKIKLNKKRRKTVKRRS